jgi:double-stranded uracil-DNA glycosylase
MLNPILDHICDNLTILFVGYNPSLRSAETGHHYANPNNRFWTILHRVGITPRKYKPEEDQDLLALGCGFTNIVARPTKTAAEITREEYEAGRKILREKIERLRPKIVCFVGKGVYEQYSRKRNISWGLQVESVVPGVYEFVGPSSSGLVRMSLDQVVEIYQRLKSLM